MYEYLLRPFKAIHVQLACIFVAIFEPQESETIKVEGHSILIEFNFAFSVRLQDVLFQVAHVDRWQWLVIQACILLLALQLYRQDTVEMLIIECKRSLAVFAMCCVVGVIDDLPEVDRIETLRVQTLARDVPDGDEDAVAIGGMGDLKCHRNKDK